MATNGHHEQYAATGPTPETNADQPSTPLPTDEVGWYFVEQYYTTLSKTPSKLHLFYGKTSQFVAGAEAEVTDVVVSRHSIAERIKKLDFQEAKVRISNVDSQSSGDNILIQVIGEISNKGGEPRKFTQTFVLAKQPSGYFVLNDMLRYIVDDVPEEAEEQAIATAPAADESAEVKDKAEASAEAPAEAPAEEKEPAELDTAAVAQKLEETVEVPAAAEPAAVEPAAVEPAAVEPAAVEPAAAEPASVELAAAEPAEAPAPEAPVAEAKEPAVEKTETQPEAEKVVEEVAAEEAEKPEEPKGPAPTPAAPAAAPTSATPVAAPAPAQPEKPKEPPKPMTWASRIAAAAGPAKPAAPAPKVATPPAPAQARAPAPAATQPVASAPQPIEGAPVPAAAKDEWQTAETKRQSRAQPAPSAAPEKEGAMAYIKYVTDKVKEEDLKTILSSFGELAYFDINRQKNCAFVEFKTQAGYTAAIAKSPITVNGESIHVEQRRPKANAYGGSNYNTSRTGTGGGRGGRAGYEPTRQGSQGGGRGGFTGQGRGRGGASRGRGAAQAGAA